MKLAFLFKVLLVLSFFFIAPSLDAGVGANKKAISAILMLGVLNNLRIGFSAFLMGNDYMPEYKFCIGPFCYEGLKKK